MATPEQVRSQLTSVLAGWAVTSLVVGAGLLARGPGERGAGVARQCLAWGGVDLALAAAGWSGRSRPMDEAARRSLRRLLLLNAALDVGYVAVGAALLRAGRVRGRDSTGDGAAVIVQGTFLLLLDSVTAARLRPAPRRTTAV